MSTRLKRWVRNPSFQFVLVLLFAPIIAIAGQAFGGTLGLKAGAAVACALIAVTALRSFRHERAYYGEIKLSHRHIIVAGLVAVIAAGAAVFLLGTLLYDLIAR